MVDSDGGMGASEGQVHGRGVAEQATKGQQHVRFADDVVGVSDEPTRTWLRIELVREARIYLDHPSHTLFVAFVLRHPQGLLPRFIVLEEVFWTPTQLSSSAQELHEKRHPITVLARLLENVETPWAGGSGRLEVLRERARVALDLMSAALSRANLPAATADVSLSSASAEQRERARTLPAIEAELRALPELTLDAVAGVLGVRYPTFCERVRDYDEDTKHPGRRVIRGHRGRHTELHLEAILDMLREQGFAETSASP
jgi:hypothetical protein